MGKPENHFTQLQSRFSHQSTQPKNQPTTTSTKTSKKKNQRKNKEEKTKKKGVQNIIIIIKIKQKTSSNQSNQIKLIDSLRKTLKGHKNWNLEREREKEREQVNSAISKSHTFIISHQKTKRLIVSVRERESGREDFFLLLAFLIKEWRVKEIERKRERRAFWAWHSLDHQNHPSKRDFRFIVFVFCFHLREREREREEERKGGKQKGRRRRDGGKKRKEKRRERKREERREERIFCLRERERETSIIKTKQIIF